MIVEQIKQQAKNKKVNLFFDMDGTCAEYDTRDGAKIKSNQPNFYFSKRPLKSIIKVMKYLSKIKNVTISILSNCHFEEQEQDKLRWLKLYCPFIKQQNIKIIVFEKIKHTKEERPFLKANYLKTVMEGGEPNTDYYLVEDDIKIMEASMKALPELNVVHISMLVK